MTATYTFDIFSTLDGFAGLIDAIEVTVFPVISGATGVDRIFDGADDFDLKLIDARTFDGDTQVLTYRPTRHG